MELLTFCRDGILRRRFHAYDSETETRVQKDIPLRAWAEGVDKDAFLKSLHSPIRFEDGLTVGEMMENLAPWADLMTGVACMDFPAFLKEIRNPTPGCAEIDRIEIGYHGEIEALTKFTEVEEMFPEREDGFFAINIGDPIKTGKLTLETGWDSTAFLTEAGRSEYEGSDSVSLSLTPVSEYAHLPLVISPDAMLYDRTADDYSSRFLGTRKSLTRRDHPNVETRTFESGKSAASKIRICAPTPTLFGCLIRGFLWDMGFSYSPAQRDANADRVKDSVAELEGKLSGEETSAKADEDPRDYEFHADMRCLEDAERAAETLGLAPRLH